MLVLESGSEDEDEDEDLNLTAAGIMNNLALHSVQHRAQLLQPSSSNPTFHSAPSSPKKTDISFDVSNQQQIENLFLQRFDEADVFAFYEYYCCILIAYCCRIRNVCNWC